MILDWFGRYESNGGVYISETSNFSEKERLNSEGIHQLSAEEFDQERVSG